MTIRPLTRRNTDGELYQRLPSVEDQITAVLDLPPASWVERARIRDAADVEYLQEETLVYLIREAYRGQNNPVFSDVAGALIDRCTLFLARELRTLESDIAVEASDEVISKLFHKIMDIDGDAGDYYQVRFWVGLDALTISAFRHYLRRVKQEAAAVPLSSLAGHEIEQDRFDDDPRPGATPTDLQATELTPEQLALCKDALAQLPEPIRTAYVLRYYVNWPVESQDSEVPSLSEWFEVTPRAIRKWFTKAERLLENWRGA